MVSKVLKSIGILKIGHLIEVTRDDLVGQHVGQTGVQTLGKIKEAYGVVLFIDEAYSLYSSNKSDFGYEAISTLIKEMEDNLEKLIVIMAGYTDESVMKSNNLFGHLYETKDNHFGNVRTARGLFERTKLHQSNRLAGKLEDDLFTIEVGDIPDIE